MEQIILYGNGSAENHGCEALTRTIQSVMDETVISLCKDKTAEEKYMQEKNIRFLEERIPTVRSVGGILSALLKRTRIDKHALMRYRTKKVGFALQKGAVAISAGGDNYCYGTFYKLLAQYNAYFRHKGLKTVLFGCSVEPTLLQNKEIVQDLKRYSLILARESLTYEALLAAGLENAKMVTDSAFILPMEEKELPEGFVPGETVGINVSSLITGEESIPGITIANYRELIKYIIENTTLQIALIPHVVVKGSDDRTVLRALYEEFRETGRVILLPDANCMVLKGFIAKCRFFIGARTHATIAAYSSFVPTLVVGYSVKAKGIAKDIFGTDKQYVLPVQSLKNEKDLTEAFRWVMENEEDIRTHLEKFIPAYAEKTKLAKTYIKVLKGEQKD